ncbi:DUF2218 domain-containing protein [Streptomyces afghaniensis]|uniref:DUF2218 domain-containing protein n=1 Tax=Streptomyces afghaniensis TaxID=66865 RepID=UPI0037878EA8
MPTAEARVETERPSRYLAQLCKHFSHKGRHLGRRLHGHPGGDGQALREMRAVAEQAQVDWADTDGQVDLPWGPRCRGSACALSASRARPLCTVCTAPASG